MIGFDFARTENPGRIGSASGVVNVGGFVASLLTILAVGLLLDTSGSSPGGDPSAQYVFWAVGLVGVLGTRRQLRRRRNIVVDAFPRAVVRRLAAARS